MDKICSNCGGKLAALENYGTDDRLLCYNCGSVEKQELSQHTQQQGSPMTVNLDCNACKKEKTMAPTTVSRMSIVVRVIGWLIAIPSIIGVVISAITLITSVLAGGHAAMSGVASGDTTGAVVGAGVGMVATGISIFFGIFSLIGGLVGYLLIMKKKVYKCTVCGFIIDRA
jgi:hypothetical protein